MFESPLCFFRGPGQTASILLLGQIQISGQPGVPAIVEIERPPIHAPHKLSSPVDASLEIMYQVATPELKSIYHCEELLLTHMIILLSW
ncbi:hypothetical protein WJX77_002525 [Trebouxia sp. C0004]